MSDTEEKTEQPTAQKLRKAREKGDVAQSKELTGSVSFMSVFLLLWLGAEFWSGKLRNVLSTALDAVRARGGDPIDPAALASMLSEALWLIAPVFALAVVAGLLTTFAQTRGVFSAEPLVIKFEKMNPAEALKGMFSTKTLGALVLMVLKLVLLATVAVMTTRHYIGPMILGISGDGGNTLLAGMSALRALFGLCGLVFVVLATLDFLQQHFEYLKKNKMSKTERKRERKENDGDPHMRSALRSQRRALVDEVSRGVGRAKVVVTNPTHYAVALHYEAGETDLPWVVAKGHDDEALRIRSEAARLGIPVLESPPLARALHARVGLGEPILPEHVEAVAEVFRWLKTLDRP